MLEDLLFLSQMLLRGKYMKIIFIHGSGGCKESWGYQTDYFKGSKAINLPGHPQGSPRREGNTFHLIRHVLDELEKAG